MADIFTAATIAIRRLALPRLSFPRFAIGASLRALSGSMGEALKMAYVNPYTSRRQPIVPDDDLDGRDPDW